MWWIDVVLSFVFWLVGYVGVCFYLSGCKIKQPDFRTLKVTRNKVLYLLFCLIAVGVLIYRLNVTYSVDLISRLSLITLVMLLLPISAIDLKTQRIPNIFLLVGLGARCIYLAVLYIKNVSNAWAITKDSLIGALIIGLFFLFLLLIFKNSVGMGDVKLFALMGFYQGFLGVFNSVFFSLLVSFFVSLTLLITRKKGRKDTISFGPSICLGTIIAICMSGI